MVITASSGGGSSGGADQAVSASQCGLTAREVSPKLQTTCGYPGSLLVRLQSLLTSFSCYVSFQDTKHPTIASSSAIAALSISEPKEKPQVSGRVKPQ